MDIFVKNCNPMLYISLRKQWLKVARIVKMKKPDLVKPPHRGC